MELRGYQNECIQCIINHFKENDRQLIQLPTGSGKTFIFLKYLRDNSKSSLIIVTSRDLLEQIYENSLTFFHKDEVFKKSTSRMKVASHYIVTSQSLRYSFMKKWVEDKIFDTIVIDEAHHATSKTYVNFLNHYISFGQKPKILGFTATPERMDGQCLLEIFNTLTFDLSFFDLIDQGFLCDIKGYRIKTNLSLKNVSRGRHKDFNLKEIRKLDNDTRNGIILKTYKDNCTQRKTLIFCVSINHSMHLSNLLKENGYKSEYITGEMSITKRKDLLNRFKNGDIQVLCNCQILTEGFDEPSIQDIIIARPTKSKSLYCQMIGRSVRLFKNKKYARVFELTDNVHNICSFNVAAGADSGSVIDYEPGITLSKMHKIVQDKISVDLKSVDISFEDINIFNSSFVHFKELEADKCQVSFLIKKNILHFMPLSYFDASFLIWKYKLGVKYGQHT